VWPGAPTTWSDPTRSPSLSSRVGVEAHIAGQQPGVAGRDQQLCVGQALVQLVERADMIHVGVGQHDPPDGLAERLGGSQDRVGAARDGRIDQRQPVVLANQVAVDRKDAWELC
jgi:hypothetical protein